MSLITLLISIAIMGVIISGVAQNMSNTLKTQKKFEKIAMLTDFQRIFRAKIHCANTKQANGGSWNSSICNTNSFIEGRDIRNSVVVAISGTTLGKYTLKLQCALNGSKSAMQLLVYEDGNQISDNAFKRVPYLCPL